MSTLIENFAADTGQFGTFNTSGSFAVTGNQGIFSCQAPGLSNSSAYENAWTVSGSPDFIVTANIGTPTWQFPFSGTFENFGPGLLKDANNYMVLEVSSQGHSSTQFALDLLFVFSGTQHNLATGNIATTVPPDMVGMGMQGNIVSCWLSFGGVWQSLPAFTFDVTSIHDFTSAGGTTGWFPGCHMDSAGQAATISMAISLLRFSEPFAAPTSNVTVPDVVGETTVQAESDITAANLNSSTTTAFSSTVAAGHVISTNPAAGTSVAFGSIVVLTISLGPDPSLTKFVYGKFAPASAFKPTLLIDAAGIKPRIYMPKENVTVKT